MTTTYVILIVAALLLILLLTGYNSLVMLRNKVNEAFATMDVCLKKRFDLIPALVEVVKGYTAHESETLIETTAMRSKAVEHDDRRGQLQGEKGIGDALKQLFVVAEDYPELKANTTFLTLQQQLSAMENEIALSRRYYNGSVREYNNRCQVVPFNLIARLFGFKTMPMFAVDSDEERRVPVPPHSRTFLLFLLLLGCTPAMADRGGFYYDNVSVTAIVHENNVWDVRERFDVVFTEPRHGIYRYIPYSYWLMHDVSGDKGNKGGDPEMVEFRYVSDIDDVRVKGWDFETERKDGNLVIRIGDEDKEVKGRQSYIIFYEYVYRDDRRPDHDYLFHTILGTDFNQPINHFQFRIKFEKPLPADIAKRLEVYSGEYGNKDNVIEGLKITAATDTLIAGEAFNIAPHQGVTLYARLPQGYYKNVLSVNPTVHKVFLWLFIGVAVLIAFYLWRTKRKHVTKVIEFYPPEGISSAEVGTIIDESADLSDIASLIPWLAGQGYLRIREIEGKKKKPADLELTKVKDLPADAPDYQKQLMTLFFKKGDVVKMKDLGEKPDAMVKILAALSLYFKGERKLIHRKSLLWLYVPLCLLGILTLTTNSMVKTFYGTAFMWALFLYGVPFLISLVGRIMMSRSELIRGYAWRRGTLLLKAALVGGVCYLYHSEIIDYGAPMDTWAVSAVIISSFVLAELAHRFCVDSDYRVRMMERLLGFKEFIETAEEDRLESLQHDDPQYFYKVLPYAMVFGLSDKWSDLFKDIQLEKPDWYDASTPLVGYAFTRHMTHSLYDSSKNAITVISHDSSSHSSGGHGFSGGGGGGGGGGSW